MAEQLVLAHSGQKLAGGGGVLRCCALRLAGVYGPGEQRHLPRIVVSDTGLTKLMCKICAVCSQINNKIRQESLAKFANILYHFLKKKIII